MSTLDARKNFAIAQTSTGYDSDDLNVELATGKGALFPQPSTDGSFNLIWWNYTDYPNPSDDPDREIVRCTARSGDVLTITRAQEGTAATAKNIAGKTYKVMLGLTAKVITDILTAINEKISDVQDGDGSVSVSVVDGVVTVAINTLADISWTGTHTFEIIKWSNGNNLADAAGTMYWFNGNPFIDTDGNVYHSDGTLFLDATKTLHADGSQLSGVLKPGDDISELNNDAGYITGVPNAFYPEDYGAVGDGVADDKAAIQACIDACYLAGGGDVVFKGGSIYLVKPLATGIGLLSKTGVRLCGKGTIRFESTTSTTIFEGIAPFGYNTATTAFSAHELWIEDITIESDGYLYSNTNNRNGHGLLGIIHCPRALIRNVTFGNVCFHQVEVGHSRNVLIDDCRFRGNTESSRLQIDCGQAGQKSIVPTNYVDENITVRNCQFAGRNITGLTLAVVRMIEINHATTQDNKNIIFDGCEFGAVYSTSSTIGYTFATDTGAFARRMSNIAIRNCKFYGQAHGTTIGIYLQFGANYIQGLSIENNYFGAGIDCDGTVHAGGFYQCITVGENFGTSITGGSTVTTNYAKRQGLKIKNNVMEPRWVDGPSTTPFSVTSQIFNVGPFADAEITGNIIMFPVYDGNFTADAPTNVLTTTGSSTTHGMRQGDPIRVTTSASDLPLGLAINTTYYVKVVLSETTFTLADINGNVIDIQDAGTGTHTWRNYLANVTMGFNVGYAVSEIPSLVFSNNTIMYQHSATISSGLQYGMIFRASALEASSIPGWWEIVNNRINEVGAGSVSIGLYEYAASVISNPFVLGRSVGNQHSGTITNKNVFLGHPAWRLPLMRKSTEVSSATPTINTNNVDFHSITALATAITSMTTNLTGTPAVEQKLTVSITDNGTARAITWGPSFESSGTNILPATTVISTRLDTDLVWTGTKWRCVGVH